MKPITSIVTASILTVVFGMNAHGQTVNSGSTGVDGDFNPTFHQVPPGTDIQGTCGVSPGCTVVVPLREPPNHIYNFATFFVGQLTTVKFKRNVANTPVILLIQGDVQIIGTMDLSGKPGREDGFGGAGGPGGFDGGTLVAAGAPTQISGAGNGPGGGGQNSPGAFAVGSLAYGNPQIQPLIGGSGAGGLSDLGSGGGGGGGALLIAASGTIDLRDGSAIHALGGDNVSGGLILREVSGSGGAIRLVATLIKGGGALEATGAKTGTGVDDGRIRLESAQPSQYFGPTKPTASVYRPQFDPPIIIFPAITPTLRIVNIANQSLPANPTADVSTPDLTIPVASPNVALTVNINLEATHVPSGTQAQVLVGPQFGSGDRIITGPITLTGAVGQPKTGSIAVTIPATGVGVISAVIRDPVVPEP
jgi:hypothetical protein